MYYEIEEISSIKIGDSLMLELDKTTGTFPEVYSDIIKNHSEKLGAELTAFVSLQQGKVRLLFGSKDIKKIGIVVDTYKLDKLLKELKSRGFENVTTKPFKEKLSSVFIIVTSKEFERKKTEIATIINFIDSHFKRSN